MVLKLAPDALSAFTGEYRAPQGSFKAEVVDGALRLSGEGSPPPILEPIGAARFRSTTEGLFEVYFEFDLPGVTQHRVEPEP